MCISKHKMVSLSYLVRKYQYVYIRVLWTYISSPQCFHQDRQSVFLIVFAPIMNMTKRLIGGHTCGRYLIVIIIMMTRLSGGLCLVVSVFVVRILLPSGKWKKCVIHVPHYLLHTKVAKWKCERKKYFCNLIELF